VAGEIVEIFLLLENISLGNFLAASETPKNDWPVDLRRHLGAAFGVDAVGFALAALLGRRAGGEANEAEQSPESSRC
jgi:hypothetical protein